MSVSVCVPMAVSISVSVRVCVHVCVWLVFVHAIMDMDAFDTLASTNSNTPSFIMRLIKFSLQIRLCVVLVCVSFLPSTLAC